MESPNQKPGIITGAIVGILLTAPLIALFYLTDQLLGLPFIPFDVFDAIGRILPGEIITTGIDAMVDTIIALDLGETSSTAKTIEQLMGLGMVMGIGVIVGGFIFFMLSRAEHNQYFQIGAGVGAFVGVLMALVSAQVNLTATFEPEVFRYVWVVLVFAGWGAAFSWIYRDLAEIAPKAEAAQATAVGEGSPAPAAEVQGLGRRDFLVRVGGATATVTVLGAGLGTLLNTSDDDVVSSPTSLASVEGEGANAIANNLPNSDAGLQAAPGTRAEYTPVSEHYRIDISSRPPVIDEVEWTLAVTGLVAEPLAYSLADLRENYDPIDQFVTLSCISNRIAGDLISTTRWTGVQLNKLIEEEWNLLPEASHLKITSADGFDEFVSLDLIRRDDRIMLAYAWDGQPLTRAHGFPIRIWIPDHYGMKQPKWITDIEVVDDWGEGYWVRRGWSETALVRTTSVIDTVAVENIVEEGEDRLIPIGGIAYSGDKQISRVEVQIDEGEWTEARLRTPLSETTWVIWRYDWPFEAGTHTFRVRCYDGSGTLQITENNGTRPDGATGIHAERENIPASI